MFHFTMPPRKGYGLSFFAANKSVKNIQTPLANIDERGEEYVITVAAPGLHRHNLRIKIENNKLFIRAKKDPDCGKLLNPVQAEYDFTEWTREFNLPPNADSYFIHAFYTNGELEIHIPKSDQPIHSSSFKVDVY